MHGATVKTVSSVDRTTNLYNPSTYILLIIFIAVSMNIIYESLGTGYRYVQKPSAGKTLT
jgi:uncharacterized membrane protein YwaF